MEQINLNIIPDGVMPVCHASQFDKNRTIRFNLNQNGSVYTLAGTETITCKVRKPDDTESTINVANTSSSYVDVTFGFSDTDLSGYAMCELKIVNGAQTIGSRNFLLNVEADAYDGSVFEERSASGEIASFETNFIDNLTECIVDIDAVQAGSGTPSPDNVRPISGWSDCNVTRCGKNLCFDAYGNKENSSSYLYPSGDNLPIIVNNTLRTAYAYVGKNQDVVVSFASAPQRSIAYGLEAYPALGVICHSLSVTALSSTSFKLNSGNYDYIAFYYCNDLGNIPSDCQIELGNQATDFEHYNGTTINIPFVDDQGDPITVYGGHLNVTTGEITVTHAKYLFDNTLSENDIGVSLASGYTQISYLPIISVGVGNSPFVSDKFENVPQLQAGLNKVWNSNNETTPRLFLGLPDTVTTRAQAVAWFASNPTEVVYELATPTEIQLTPTEVRTLLNNNIFADTGNIEVKYLIEVV